MHPGSFDRAAKNYDDTRGFPPGIGELVAEAAVAMLPGGASSVVLDVGVGTGRVARPLLRLGVPVTGLDVSRRMMQRLLEALPAGTACPGLIQGAAEALPVAAGVFDAVVSVHVFHLLSDWRAALAEVRRVLRPGGTLLTGYDWRPPDAPGTRLMERWRAIVRAHGLAADGPGTTDFADIKMALLATGCEFDERLVGEWVVTRTLARHLETIEHRTWSYTWQVPDGFFATCLAELREWARREYGALDREFQVTHRFVWQRFTWPRAGL